MESHKALLLVGSPRGAASVSHSLGNRLLTHLKERGLNTDKAFINTALETPLKTCQMLEAVAACDLLILAFPLYVDHLPAPVIRVLKMIAEEKSCHYPAKPQALAAIVNCGFPETIHCQPAANIVKIFAEQTGFTFHGCLAMGMGGMVGTGERLDANAPLRRQLKALKSAAAALAAGWNLQASTLALMGTPPIPKWFYIFMANWGWRKPARQHGAWKRMRDRPYEEKSRTS